MMWKQAWSLPLLMVMVICLTSWASAFDNITESACSSTQFECSNGHCISLSWHCDGEDDCHDESDEKNCPMTTCGESYFRCVSDGKCIPEGWKCDEASDCHDSSDEDPHECSQARKCAEDEFKCADNSTCIQRTWLCDGENDCTDGSDELHCEKPTCDENDFQCASDGQCISAKWKCDKSKDCKDGSDELNCPESQCGEFEFNCTNGKCIQDSWRCDGDDDCDDMSDEMNCPPPDGLCRESEFQCKTLDRMCIHMSWKCDGDDDCEDESDEKNCNITCSSDQFLCDTYCIHESLRCDGQLDCINGLDEENCPSTPPTGPSCKNNTFDCFGDGTKCIGYNLVCDDWNDCGNYEDERTEENGPCPAVNPCEENNGGCQQICYRSPEGPVCDCHLGFKFANGSKTECVDIDECSIPGKCSQKCINTKGSYKCECVSGYRLEKDGYCKATTGDPQLLLADRKDLRRYHLQSKVYTLLIENQKIEGAIAMDFHFANNCVYWSDVTNGEIKRVNLKENVIETVASENISTPDGLAVDWVHGHLYWTDTGLDHIEVAALDGSMRSVLIRDGLDEPRAIALHPRKGLMYWTDWGSSPKIESCGMNGQHRKTIISEEITWPNGLTIDFVDDRLYWIDAKTHQIGSSDLDGLNRRMILRGHQYLGHPFSITVFEDFLYWSDWPSDSIRRYNKFQKGEVETIAQGLDTPMDIHIYHPYRQEAYASACGDNNGGCEHFCLPDPFHTYTCVCKTGYMPDHDDNTKCIEGEEAAGPTRPNLPSSNTTLSPNRSHQNRTGVPPPTTSTASPKPTTPKPITAKPTTAKPITSAPETTHPNTTPKGPVVSTAYPSGITTERSNATEGVLINKETGEGIGHVAIIVIGIVFILLIVIVIVGVFIYRRHRNKNIKSMNFDNPVYRKTTTADDDKVFVEVSGSRQNLPSTLEPLNPDNELV